MILERLLQAGTLGTGLSLLVAAARTGERVAIGGKAPSGSGVAMYEALFSFILAIAEITRPHLDQDQATGRDAKGVNDGQCWSANVRQ